MLINQRKLNKYKYCWLAKEVKNGWKLYLCVSNKEFPVTGALFTNMLEISQITGHKGKVVYSHLKNTKYPIK